MAYRTQRKKIAEALVKKLKNHRIEPLEKDLKFSILEGT